MAGITATFRPYVFVGCVLFVFHFSLIKGWWAITKFIVVDRILGIFTRTVDALMIFFIINDPIYGVLKAFFIAGAYNFLLCAVTVGLNNYLAKKNYDLTGLGWFVELDYEKPVGKSIFVLEVAKRWFLTAKNWMLRRRATIFWIGSWFQLDPDYVTLLLQDRQRGYWRIIFSITLPSVAVAMIVWTFIYWFLLRGIGVINLPIIRDIVEIIADI